uniref:Pre-glycoprotein polyprotein GP complex n=1 Tax=Tacaribe virus (strain V5) TaxID=31615 RepID=GLYC_TACV5|nr:RecName: Full=Pre-glycoprotein polyprotein GP complex; Short=Pre-GP-C; Contains: RecName: Full=Stable signal peptide; Short=SSP; Contains: RecName: Full=Glycoprotein G1; Short=GP1; Contains: RecName: Full=Glycoprotein G2; Short=GP2 [Tacaribe virus strain V5]
MGQFISFMQEIPIFLQEALNIALVAVSLICIVKGLVNLYRCGLFQLMVFLVLAGRSCSEETFKIGMHTQFQEVSLSLSALLTNQSHELPMLCLANKTHLYLKSGRSSFKINIDSVTVLTRSADVFVHSPKLGSCFESDEEWVVAWWIEAIGHRWDQDPGLLCRNKTKTEGKLIQINISRADGNVHYGWRLKNGLDHIYRGREEPCFEGEQCLIKIQPEDWPTDCKADHTNTFRFLSRSQKSIAVGRTLKAFFSWSLTDPLGNVPPGGYCLEKWMLVASELKCFGNTAIAKCNQNHDSEFCDMLRLFDYNKNAIKTLNEETKTRVNVLSHTINALISDNLLMKNKIRELMSVPYCNYTRFWYVNHTLSGQHSLPRCWMIRNNSYLNSSEFRNEWILESDFLISEMLSKEYSERQGRTPITLVDICFWSTVFFTSTLFLHLIGFPTHEHIRGEGCPLPHRLNSMGGCRCGKYLPLKKPTIWHRRH